jgi:large subunit ribosomal protein L35
MKTNRGAAKRFHVAKSGKISRRKAGASHILTKKSRKRKRSLKQEVSATSAGKKLIKKLMPYD